MAGKTLLKAVFADPTRTAGAPRRGLTWQRRRTNFRRRSLGAVVGAVVLSVAGVQSFAPVASASSYDPATDAYSMAALAQHTGVTAWWNAGYTGAGIDVAMIDTGVSPVAGLDAPGKIIYGPDLSLESQAPNLRNFDTNGHGTFMAGVIAGRDAGLSAPYSNAPASAYRGIAPDARIVSVKVATADGGVDVSQVIAAIDWVIQHRNDNGLNIRVLNLSYASNSDQASEADPLSYAVEQAWKHGIVVVAAAGNTGTLNGNKGRGLSSPAYNPFVIGVGGYDTNGTENRKDDFVGSYSANASGCLFSCKNPDFVAAGSHVQGLRVPNSFNDIAHPSGRRGDRYFRGSGTSQAAAVASGAAALILQKYPELTPDEVKAFMTKSASSIKRADKAVQGDGALDLEKLFRKKPKSAAQSWTGSTGAGSLELARGKNHISRDGVLLTGEIDIFGNPFNAADVASHSALGTAWIGGTWNGSSWSGATWSGATWSGATWSGSSWSGSSWSGSSWSGSSWSGSSWSGSSWSGSSWSGSSWSGSSWSGGVWATSSWT